ARNSTYLLLLCPRVNNYKDSKQIWGLQSPYELAMLSVHLVYPSLLLFQQGVYAFPGLGSIFAGSTSTAAFPPPGVTDSAIDSFFPDGSQVGFPGPTPTGDEPDAIATAPAVAKVDSIFPLVKPAAFDDRNKAKSSFDVLQHLGSLSPWQSVESFGLPKASALIPAGCKLQQVHLVHRHGARYPTGDAGTGQFATNIHGAAQNGTFSASGDLSFLNTWTYKLGAEILTPFGRSQLFNLGVGFSVKYGELLKDFKQKPVFRTTSEARMLDSALHFAAGFFGVQAYQEDYHQVITIETPGQNNTLAPFFNCPNSNNDIGAFGVQQATKWAQKYLQPTLKRLSPLIKGYTLQLADLIDMQQLCAYETVSLGFSDFCGVFTEDEWKSFEYFWDLMFWYGNGPGNPSTAAQGIGYVTELVSRLTQTPITTFDSTVNATIVSNNITFPLDQPIFVDATHDTVLSTIYVAMNFTSLAANGPLPTDHIPKGQSYFVNQITPFATNLVGQVLSCPASEQPTHIRWILNDGVLPLTGIKGCKANNDGLCELPTFIAAMKQRIAEVDFDFGCFANYTVPNPDNIVDGQLPLNLRVPRNCLLITMGSNQSLPKITPQDRAILDLKLQRDKLKQYQKKVCFVRNVATIEFSLVEVSVLHGLKQGNEVLKEIHKEMNVESVEKLLEESAEAREYQKEISDMLANNLSLDEEDDVQRELLALQEEIETEASHQIELPTVPNDVPVATVKEDSKVPASDERAKVAIPA
ncbi:hypothetical protein CVT24_006084, partial [Panaeolus cyanescens]